MKAKLISLAIAGLFVSSTVLAEDKSWTGLKIGVGVGGSYSSAKSNLNASHDTYSGVVNDTITSDGYGEEWFDGDASGKSNLGKALGFGTFDATYDWQVSDNVVFGIIGNYDVSARSKVKGNASGGADTSWNYEDDVNYSGESSEGSEGTDCSATTCYTSGSADSRTGASSSFETGNSGALGLRLGMLANKDTLLYVTGGWTTIKVKQSASYSSNINYNDGDYSYSTSSNRSSNENGYFVGAGIQTKFTDHISAKLEYRYSDYGSIKNNGDSSVTLSNSPVHNVDLTGSSSINQKTDLTLHTIRAVVSYDF